MSRLPELPFEAMDERQRAVHQRIATGPRGRVRGPLAAWLRSPAFAEAIHPTGEYLRYHSLLSGRLAELAILLVARHWNCDYEWYVHAPLALQVGISPEVVSAIAHARTPRFTQPDEQCIWDIVSAMLANRKVPADTYERALATLGEGRLVELTGLAGYYSLGAFTLNLFEIHPPPDAAPALPPR